jgi:NADH dehydrogenase
MIFIAGGTGFIGKHLIRALKEKGYASRCLARKRERAALCEETGFEVAVGDITDRESLRRRLDGAEMVVHLVGIIEERNGVTFEKVHVEGTANLVDEAKAAGVKHFFYQSALGASPESPAKYHRTKAEAEEIVKGSGLPFTIFRPSLVIGEKDGFTEKLKDLVRLAPVVAIPGSGNARFQPIDVDDLVKCLLAIIDNKDAFGRTYELGGPDHLTYNELVAQLMDVMGVKKPLVHLPIVLAKAGIPFVGLAQSIGKFFGKEVPTVTAEQLSLLEQDNICAPDAVEKSFKFRPIPYKDALRKFILSSR